MQTPAPTRRTLLAGLSAGFAALASTAHASTPPSGWADMELLDAEDRSFRLNQSRQPLTLVTLWANWCGVCMRELDSVASIVPAIGADKISAVLLSHPDDWARNQEIIRSRRLRLPTARPSSRNAPSLLQNALLSPDGTFYVPRSILFSRDSGQVVWSRVGELDWRRPEVVGLVMGFAT